MNSSDLISRVRKLAANSRDDQDCTWNTKANFAIRKFLYCGPYRLRMLDSSLWNWIANLCLGTILGFMFHRVAFLFVVADLASFLILHTIVAVAVAFLLPRSKRYLDQLDVPLLDHFSTLPWSNRRLLMHFLAATVSRSGFAFAFWTISGIGLPYWLKVANPPTLLVAMVVSWAVCASLVVWQLFLRTIDPGRLRTVLLAVTFLAPFAWPYGMLWISAQGANVAMAIPAIISCCLAVICLFFVTVKRLNRRLTIVEYIGHSPASFAIPFSEMKGFLHQQRLYEPPSTESVASTFSFPSVEAALPTECEPEFSQWKQRMDYCKQYWSRQGAINALTDRFLSDREKQVVALAELLRNERDFPSRIVWLHAIQAMCMFIIFCLIWLSQLSMLGVLLNVTNVLLLCATWAPVQFVSQLVAKVPINTLRSMPYSSREIVWALVKRCWIESVFLLPIVALTIVFGAAISSNLSLWDHLARLILIAVTLLFSLPMAIVSFRLQENTHQSAVNFESLRFVFWFFLGILGVVIAGAMTILGGAVLAPLGAVLLLSVSYGFSEMLIGVYRSRQLDLP